MISIEVLAFYTLAASAIISALLVVSTQNIVRSIFLFFVTLFSVAGLFVFSLADFVAITQVVIYVGGILVLMLFAFLLSNKELLNNLDLLKIKSSRLHLLPGLLISGVFLFILISVVLSSDFDNSKWIQKAKAVNTISPSDNTTHNIGINLMTKYLLPFEVVSVFLMMALIGAAHLARKEQKE